MNIVVFAHFAGSPKHGMVFGHYYLAREWVKMGHAVTIIAAGFAHVRTRQPDMREGKTEELIDGIRYIWVPTPSYEPSSARGRAINILTFALRCRVTDFGLQPPDLVVCSSHHPFAIHAANRLARAAGARLVFEVRDLWPLTLIELGRVSRGNPFIRAMQWSEDYAYRHADRVVSVLAGARDYMIGRGMAPEKFAFIPNGVDLSERQTAQTLPASHVRWIERQRAEGNLLIGYAGRIGDANALGSLVEAIGLCQGRPVAAAILGDGQYLETIRAQAQSLGCADRIAFLEPVPKAQVQDFLARIDVAYIGLRASALFRHGVSPTKLNDYMLAAKPIVSAMETPDNIVEQSGAGLVCAPEDPVALSAAIGAFLEMGPAQRAAMGEAGRRWIGENRDYRVLAARFLQAAAGQDAV